jgi:2-oxoisovalerate dehydrogenase E2 component (dihydrolipoyl transacylase)
VGEPVETEPVGEPVETEPVESGGAVAYREEEMVGSGIVLIGYGTPGGCGAAQRTRAPRTAVSPAQPTIP